MRRLGPEKNVNGQRILLLYTNFDIDCVYPAELMRDSAGTFAKKLLILGEVDRSPNGVYIERNVKYIFD